jgi:proline dehydrogenase
MTHPDMVNTPISFSNTEKAFSHLTDEDLDFSIKMFQLMQSPSLVKVGTALSKVALAANLPITGIVKSTVFRQFCGGVDLEESLKKVAELNEHKVGSILDYAVEGAQDELTFDHTAEQIINVIRKAKTTDGIPVASMKMTGIIRFALLEKMSGNIDLDDAEKMEYKRGVDRFDAICKASFETGIPIYVDAEETWIQPAIDRLIESRMRVYNTHKAIVFHTLQMYRKDKIDHLKKLIEESKREGWVLGIKFVRGAYLEKENKRAADMGYPTPMQPNKAATDRDFDLGIQLTVENIDHCEICNGTHNALSTMKLVDLMRKHNLPNNDSRIYFSQLKGMSDTISFNLADAGYNVSKYLPYGPVKATIPYLTRRAEENTAIAGQMGKELADLLAERERRKKAKS